MEEKISRLRYKQTLRTLDRQAVVLGELRTRASILLTATGFVTALLGADALARPMPWWWVVIAVVVTATGLACCIIVLMPVHDEDPKRASANSEEWRFWRRLWAHVWHSETDPRQWRLTLSADELDELSANADDVSDLLDKIVLKLGPARKINYKTTEMLTTVLTAAGGLLIGQIAVWTIVLLRYPRPPLA